MESNSDTDELDADFEEFHSYFSNLNHWLETQLDIDFVLKLRHTRIDHRDDLLNDLVCCTAHNSIMDVVGQLYEPTANCFPIAKLPEEIFERAVASFDLMCKDLSIETCAEAVKLKENIQLAAKLASDYSRQNEYEYPLRVRKICDYYFYMSLYLQIRLRGKYITEDITISETALDDDLVAIQNDLKEIKEQLLGNDLNRQIVPVVGMGGIGKTTLTRRVYEDPEIVHHFHVRAWVVVSVEYRERDVLLGLLESIAPLAEEVYGKDNGDLAQRLYKRLRDQRYLIVIDDIWTPKAWEDMKLCFPDDINGSRIVLTSRVVELASHINPCGTIHSMNFLGLGHSWDLLCKQVFGKEACPSQLVNVGKRIAGKCQGLPLVVKVVAGHLSSIAQTQVCWEKVADTVGLSTKVTKIESVINILSLSYNNLPGYLKACFLSLVIYPKNYEIQVKELIWLWTSMGFLYPDLENNEEEVAEGCLEDLVGRNLIMVRGRRFDGRIRSFAIHDLLWDLSMREARKDGDSIFKQSPLNHPYFYTGDDNKYVMSLTHTLLYFDKSFELDCPISAAGFKVLRILRIVNQSFDKFPNEITDLVNLRYLRLITCSDVPGSVSKLRNLEILMIINEDEKAGVGLPKEIWLLRRLRHLHMKVFTCVPDPSRVEIGGGCVSVLSDLQTLDSVSSTSCTKEVLLKIPNLKELGIHEIINDNTGDDILNCLSNLIFLSKLQKLKLHCNVEVGKPRCIPQWNSFIPNIKRLILIGSHLQWNEINTLTMLPHLEVLKLKIRAASDKEWEMDGVFLQLKYLLLESLPLQVWKLNADQFPNLQRLVIRDCNLDELPIELGEIPTLKLIDMDYFEPWCLHTRRNIYAAQQEVGNDKFTIRAGRVFPTHQLLILVRAFVYMVWLLRIHQENQAKSSSKEQIVDDDECSCNSLSTEPSGGCRS